MITEYGDIYVKDLLRISQLMENFPEFKGLKGKKFLITGANGLIAAAFVDFLLFLNDTYHYDIQVILAVRNKQKAKIRFGELLERLDVELFYYDAMETERFIPDIDYILHAASPANPRQYQQFPVETMHANYIGIKNILDYGKKHSCRILFISSSEVYGLKNDQLPFKESDYGYVDSLNPRACYPSVKRVAETLCVAYHEEFGVDVLIARPGHVYGPTSNLEDNRAATDFLFHALAKSDIVLRSEGLQQRSYCYVVDCVSALAYLLTKGQFGKAYNIASTSMNASIKDLAQAFCLVANRQLVFDIAENNGQKNPMNHAILDGSNLQSLGWQSCFSLDEGVLHTYQIMKKMQNRWLKNE